MEEIVDMTATQSNKAPVKGQSEPHQSRVKRRDV